MPPAARRKSKATEDSLQAALEALREEVARSFVLTADRVQASFEDSVRRGRMTRTDAEELAQRLLEHGRRQRQELLTELESALGRSASGLAEAGRRAMDSVEATASLAKRAAGIGRFPIAGYDELIVSQVVTQLGDLSQTDLRTVREYERGNANRKSVLAAIDKRLD